MKHIKIVLFSLAVMILFCAKGHANNIFSENAFRLEPTTNHTFVIAAETRLQSC